MATARERGQPATSKSTRSIGPASQGWKPIVMSHHFLARPCAAESDCPETPPCHCRERCFCPSLPGAPKPCWAAYRRNHRHRRHCRTITLDAIDVLDGTPVIDLKPYFASTDALPDATPGRSVKMIADTGRQRAIAKALTALLPLAPYADTEGSVPKPTQNT